MLRAALSDVTYLKSFGHRTINEVTVEFDHNSSGKLAVLSDTIKYVQLVRKKNLD
jgi:hypothetical protein